MVVDELTEDMGTPDTKSDTDTDRVDPSWEPVQLQKAYEKTDDDNDSISTQQYACII